MTDKEAEELLDNNPWAKYSDARSLLKQAAALGAAAERKRLRGHLIQRMQGFDYLADYAEDAGAKRALRAKAGALAEFGDEFLSP